MKYEEINYILDEYLPKALRTWEPSKIHGDPETYLRLGYISEVGELADVHKQRMRDGSINRARLVEELGDVLWYAAVGYHFAVDGVHKKHHLADISLASGTVESLAATARRSASEVLAGAVAAIDRADLGLRGVGEFNNRKLAARLEAGTVTAETREEVE